MDISEMAERGRVGHAAVGTSSDVGRNCRILLPSPVQGPPRSPRSDHSAVRSAAQVGHHPRQRVGDHPRQQRVGNSDAQRVGADEVAVQRPA